VAQTSFKVLRVLQAFQTYYHHLKLPRESSNDMDELGEKGDVGQPGLRGKTGILSSYFA